MAKEDGGSAFPNFESEHVYLDERDRNGEKRFIPKDGMTLRDYFAAHAVAALKPQLTGEIETDTRAIAQYAYRIADAMIAERGQEPA